MWCISRTERYNARLGKHEPNKTATRKFLEAKELIGCDTKCRYERLLDFN